MVNFFILGGNLLVLSYVLTIFFVNFSMFFFFCRCGANPNKKNEKGETPYDLAVKSGVDSISNKLASSLGQSQLDKLIKPKAASKVDF